MIIIILIISYHLAFSHASNCPTVHLHQLQSNETWTQHFGPSVPQLNFTIGRGEKASFFLKCEHNSPIRWILDEDPKEIVAPTPCETFRKVKKENFGNRDSYIYEARYYVDLQNPSKDHIFLCQPFDEDEKSRNCSLQGSVVAKLLPGLLTTKSKNVTVKVLSANDVTDEVAIAPVLLFQNRLEKQKAVNNTFGECPFTLTLGVNYGLNTIIFGWTPKTGTQDSHSVKSAQTLSNTAIFYPQLEEDCITFIEDVTVLGNFSCCSEITYNTHKFFPQVLSYALGNERRALKLFFDLEDFGTVYYAWEQVSPEKLILGKGPRNQGQVLPIYKGQHFKVTCSPSVFLFSRGTLIGFTLNSKNGSVVQSDWGKERESEDDWLEGGWYEITADLYFDRDFLLEKDVQEISVTCVSPVWNSSDWVNKAFSLPFHDSLPPEIISWDENIENSDQVENVTVYTLFSDQEEFVISCGSVGIPDPDIQFVLPKNNLQHFIDQDEMSVNGTFEARLYLSNITKNYEGLYTCVSKNVVGESQKLFKIVIKPGFSKFLLIALIIGGSLTLLFLIIGSLLIVKLKRERAEFLAATEEAVRKFREGFQSSDNLGFKPSEEYKNYEIPLARWGLGSTLLGSGAFGVVQKGVIYYGDNRSEHVAVKTVSSPKDIKDFEASLMELTIMSYIGKHEHVVSLVGACTDNLGKRSVLIGVEYCANGDLLNYMKKRRALFRSFVSAETGLLLSLENITGRGSYANVVNSGSFTSLDLYKWSFQIANGMEYLSSKKILHADLAARNVLLTQDNIAKISDFGLSRLITSDNYTKTTNAPLPWRWMAIESLKYRNFSVSSDMWAYGVTLWEVFTLGEEPWPGMGWTTEFMEEMEKGRRLNRPKFGTQNMYEKVMLETWRQEPGERISFAVAKAFFETGITNLTSPEGKESHVLNSMC